MTHKFSPIAVARWSARRPWLALACWLAFVLLAIAALALTGSKSLQPGTAGEAARADTMLKTHKARPVEHEYAYLHSATLSVGSPAFGAAIAKVTASMTDTLGGPTTTTVSADGHSALIAGPVGRPFSTQALAVSVASAGDGQVTATLDDNSTDGSNNSDLQRAERLSIPVTLLVLLIAFGAVVAAVVPVVLGVTAVAAAFGLLGPISQIFPLDSSVKTIVVLIGMAVGVDYALFYVIRSREERAQGLAVRDAIERTARTSGHTVIIAGTTVAIAMAGQFIIGSPVASGIAAGTIAVVACAVAASITALPAVLALLGSRLDRGRIRFLPHLTAGERSRLWPWLVDRVLRHPAVSLLTALAALLTLAVPALGLHVADPASTEITPRVSAAVQTQIDHDFPGTSRPALVVFSVPSSQRAAAEHAAQQLEDLAVARGIAHPPFTQVGSLDHLAGILQIPLSGLGDDSTSKKALDVLRTELVPQTLGRVPGVQVAVGGATADDVDSTRQLTHGMPYVIAFVLALAFLLLLLTFRSLVIPIKAILLNLLSVGASYGVLVLVFQQHWAQGLLGFHDTGFIIAWLPVFLFVVLFGLSMDYHIFILNRVREAVHDGMTNDQAVRYGITRTAGVVTSAALVMFGVFSLFGTANSFDLKQAGVGLAVAVLLDATIVRGVLLPASMKLLGDWNWYLPAWLEWLPGAPNHAPTRGSGRTPAATRAAIPAEAQT